MAWIGKTGWYGTREPPLHGLKNCQGGGKEFFNSYSTERLGSYTTKDE